MLMKRVNVVCIGSVYTLSLIITLTLNIKTGKNNHGIYASMSVQTHESGKVSTRYLHT